MLKLNVKNLLKQGMVVKLKSGESYIYLPSMDSVGFLISKFSIIPLCNYSDEGYYLDRDLCERDIIGVYDVLGGIETNLMLRDTLSIREIHQLIDREYENYSVEIEGVPTSFLHIVCSEKALDFLTFNRIVQFRNGQFGKVGNGYIVIKDSSKLINRSWEGTLLTSFEDRSWDIILIYESEQAEDYPWNSIPGRKVWKANRYFFSRANLIKEFNLTEDFKIVE